MYKLLFLLLSLCVPLVAMAHDKLIIGTVMDVQNIPMPGVTILKKGTINGTTTDSNGHFSLTVTTKDTLVVSYIGYVRQEIPVTGSSSLSIVMQDETMELDDIVVVGYGVQKKSSLTASVASVNTKEIRKQVTGNVMSALQGRIPGVDILQKGGEAGADVRILIRGAGSFGSTEPLYVIDGAFSNNGLASLNVNDIISIEILKDAAAAAIYGSRAANGVVLITTKLGRAGETLVELSSSFSLQTPSRKLNFMNAEQWRIYANMLSDNSPSFDRAPQNVNPTNPDLNTDWQDIYLRNAPIYQLNASVSGGGKNGTFSTSMGYFNQEGVVVKSGYEKYNARVNTTYQKGIFSLQENLSLAYSQKKPQYAELMILMPTVPVQDEQGRYISQPGSAGYSIGNSEVINPLAQIYYPERYNRLTDITGSINVRLDLFKGFSYRLNFSGSYLNTHAYVHTPEYATCWNEDGSINTSMTNSYQKYTSLQESKGTNFNYTIDNLLAYTRSFSSGYVLTALLGTSWMREYYRAISINTDTNDLGASFVNGYGGMGTIDVGEMNSALLSFFARVNCDYQNRYLLSVSIRSDKSSKFAKGYRTGYFPSVSAGWNVHKERFFHISGVSKLKIRGSYGELGSNFINPYSFLSTAYGPVPTVFGDNRYLGYVTRFAQKDLTWETSISADAGLEIGFLDDRLNFNADLFLKRNNDLLAPLESLPSSGQNIVINEGDVPYYNTASVENKGLELSLGYRDHWGDISLDVQGNIAFLKNKVLKLGQGAQPIRGSGMSSKFNDRPTITTEGLPIGTFWGYQITGIDDKGDFIFEDNNGLDADGNLTGQPDGTVNENDKKAIGNPTPKYTYGLNINLGYRQWDLTLFFQGVSGNDLFNGSRYKYYFDYGNNNLVDALNAWTPENRETNIPIAKADNFTGGNSLPSTFYIENGSYFRCKNLQIGYSFKSRSFIRSARVYAGIQNLFTLTRYSGYDPEVSDNTLFDRGTDGINRNASTINTRVYNIGFHVTF